MQLVHFPDSFLVAEYQRPSHHHFRQRITSLWSLKLVFYWKAFFLFQGKSIKNNLITWFTSLQRTLYWMQRYHCAFHWVETPVFLGQIHWQKRKHVEFSCQLWCFQVPSLAHCFPLSNCFFHQTTLPKQVFF